MTSDAPPDANRVLATFPPHGRCLIEPHLQLVTLVKGEALHAQGAPIESVCFPVSGVCSLFAVSSYGRRIETNMVGREGLIGLALLLGADRSPEEACVLIGGEALKLPAEILLDVAHRHRDVRDRLLRYVQAATVQASHTALSHGLDVIETRLARWLLMACDRAALDDLPLTHDQLSTALGVRRSGVTHALHLLEGERLISARRGMITITDREGLKRLAGPSYGVPEAEYERLLAA